MSTRYLVKLSGSPLRLRLHELPARGRASSLHPLLQPTGGCNEETQSKLYARQDCAFNCEHTQANCRFSLVPLIVFGSLEFAVAFGLL